MSNYALGRPGARTKAALTKFRAVFSNKWILFYREGAGSKPTDSHWRKFQSDLNLVFQSLCAYCERYCTGEVDHFQPKSKFPELVYQWTNWLYVCHECNLARGSKWPNEGYVDPCSENLHERPEQCFTFETVNGFIFTLESTEYGTTGQGSKNDIRPQTK